MPRPRKWRQVCCEPQHRRFGPLDASATESRITMSVEEYETLRLIDVEKLTQEECAQRMDVARTSVTKMYEDARYKSSLALVEGRPLHIEGGDYRVYDDNAHWTRCRQHRRWTIENNDVTKKP
jgi:predicted DNA-binding protein (UPF0251 family)